MTSPNSPRASLVRAQFARTETLRPAEFRIAALRLRRRDSGGVRTTPGTGCDNPDRIVKGRDMESVSHVRKPRNLTPRCAQLLDTPCKVISPLTHSKQRKGVTIKCHTFAGSDCATATPDVPSILRNSASRVQISNRQLPLLQSSLSHWKQTIAPVLIAKKSGNRVHAKVPSFAPPLTPAYHDRLSTSRIRLPQGTLIAAVLSVVRPAAPSVSRSAVRIFSREET